MTDFIRPLHITTKRQLQQLILQMEIPLNQETMLQKKQICLDSIFKPQFDHY
jgi:hypothetical protein